jgi:hypothetical protein
VKYRKGYKYQLAKTENTQTELHGHDIDTEFIKLLPSGMLTIRSGYAWDGASGPALDTESSMRGSLVHDALYQLMRMGLLPQSVRGYADELLADICKEDGMWAIRAEAWEAILGVAGKAAADPKNKKQVYTAP